MELTEIITTFGPNSIFLSLFLYVFINSDKRAIEREKKQNETIVKLTEAFDILSDTFDKLSLALEMSNKCHYKEDLKK